MHALLITQETQKLRHKITIFLLGVTVRVRSSTWIRMSAVNINIVI